MGGGLSNPCPGLGWDGGGIEGGGCVGCKLRIVQPFYKNPLVGH